MPEFQGLAGENQGPMGDFQAQAGENQGRAGGFQGGGAADEGDLARRRFRFSERTPSHDHGSDQSD